MQFSKTKAVKRIKDNLLDTYCDNTMLEIFDNLDGQQAVKLDNIGRDELICKGKDGSCYYVKAVDCI